MKTKIKSTAKIAGLIILALFFMPILHELSHYYACEILGKEATMQFNMINAKTACLDIAKEDKLTITTPQYIFYAIIPYIVDLIIVISLSVYRIKKPKYLNEIIITTLFLDIVYNYVATIFIRTDFLDIARISPILFAITAIIPLIGFILTYKVLKK